MKVFVVGATGVVGRPAVRALVAAGHEVVGLARSAASAGVLAALGARSASAGLFDTEALTRAMDDQDVVVNLATHIPPLGPRALLASTLAGDSRIRTEGSRCLPGGRSSEAKAGW